MNELPVIYALIFVMILVMALLAMRNDGTLSQNWPGCASGLRKTIAETSPIRRMKILALAACWSCWC